MLLPLLLAGEREEASGDRLLSIVVWGCPAFGCEIDLDQERATIVVRPQSDSKMALSQGS